MTTDEKPRRRPRLAPEQVRKLIAGLRRKPVRVRVLRVVRSDDPYDIGFEALAAASVEMLANENDLPMAGWLHRNLQHKIATDPEWANVRKKK